MKVISFDASTEADEVIIYPLGDMHIGDAYSSKSELLRIINIIKETPNAYTILNGDLVDNATTSSIGDTYSAQLSPMSQIMVALELLEPIKDKIISVTSGNHELRSMKSDGLDITQFLCAHLNILPRYDREGCYIFLTTGKNGGKNSKKTNHQVYGIYHTHGSGGGKRAGSTANQMEDMTGIVDADLYIRGHSHRPMAFPIDYYRSNFANHKISKVTQYMVTTNAFLNWGGYAEQKGYRPTTIVVPEIHLKAHLSKEIRVLI